MILHDTLVYIRTNAYTHDSAALLRVGYCFGTEETVIYCSEYTLDNCIQRTASYIANNM